MTEIKKITKIALLVIGIPNFIYGILSVFLTDMLVTIPTGWTNPLHPRIIGGLFFLTAVFSAIMIRKKEWEEIKLTFAFYACMLLSTIIINIAVVAIISPTLSASVITQNIFETILMGSMFALSVISYIKQER